MADAPESGAVPTGVSDRVTDPDRLASLRTLELLDTPSEERFDRITRTVARLLDVPVVVLNLVDGERQWAKSAVGMPQGTSVERSSSFCALVVADDGPMTIPDTLADARFATNPLVVDDDPGLRCYLGVPVHAPDGATVGSLCIAGHEPRALTEDDARILADLGGWVEAELTRGRLLTLTRHERAVSQRLETITAALGEGVLVFDRRGVVVHANEAAAALLATPSTPLIDVELTDALPLGTGRDQLLGLLRGGPLRRPMTTTLELARFDGTTLPVEMTIASTLDERWFVVVARDVSERQRHERNLEQLRRRYEVILDVAADAILRIDREGIVEYANPAAERLLGVPADSLLGVALHERHHHHHLDGSPYRWESCPSHVTLRTGEAQYVGDEHYLRADGSEVAVEYTSTPVFAGADVVAVVMVMRDVAERRELERMKSAFVATVSHELRTPLTSIKGAIGLILGGVFGELESEPRGLLEVAANSTDRLVRLVNDLLDLSRLEAGQLHLERRSTTVRELVDDALEGMRAMATTQRVRLEAEVEDSTLVVDPDRIVQVLTNLVGNAIRFSPVDHAVRITASTDGHEVRIDVTDEGRGIPAEAHGRIFERFGQADSSDGRQGAGTGLGLPIARQLTEAHGGRLTLGHAEQGTVFHVWLPHSPADHAGAPPDDTRS